MSACSDAVLAFAELSSTTGLYVPVECLRRRASGCLAYKLEREIGDVLSFDVDNVTVRFAGDLASNIVLPRCRA